LRPRPRPLPCVRDSCVGDEASDMIILGHSKCARMEIATL
jgi:hypothetical protein